MSEPELETPQVSDELVVQAGPEVVPEAVSQVSPTLFEVSNPVEEPVNGCDTITELPPSDNPPKDAVSSSDTTTTLASESPIIEAEEETNTPKTSRELKSILALSKEAKLDTNLSPNRRKSESKSKLLSKKSKMTNFPVTAESELENFDVKVEEKRPAAKKRKSSLNETPTEGSSDEAKKGLHGDFVMPRKVRFPTKCNNHCLFNNSLDPSINLNESNVFYYF